MGEIYPVLPGHNLHQRSLNLLRCSLTRQTKPVRQPRDVCVHDDAFSFAVGDAEDDTGGFTAATVELEKFVHRGRHLAGMTLGDGLATGADGFGFVAKESSRANHYFQFAGRRGGEVGGGPVFREERGRNFVDAFVGALGAEDGGDEKLERIVVLQCALGVGVGSAQPGQEFLDAL